MSFNDKINSIKSINKTYIKKLSIVSKTTTTSNENNENLNQKEKRHIKFKKDFITIIDVESWKELNFDVSEIDPDWKKVENDKIEINNNRNLFDNKNIKNCFISENKVVSNMKKKENKISCECILF
jgi:hypothetical protein